MSDTRVLRDQVYVRWSSRTLALDLYLPGERAELVPTIIWIHGGAWRTGSKDDTPAAHIVDRGYAVASISYRLSQEATYPAQLHDCKAAVRWLRGHADRYGLDPEHIGAWGASAGGHLAALLGTTGDVAELEGPSGDPGHSSQVRAVCDFFGPTDFMRMNDMPGVIDHDASDSPESQLIGGPIQDYPQEVARANPITYATGEAAPFLIVHGADDRIVPPDQSRLLYSALWAAGVEATLHIVPGAGHGFRGATAAQWSEIDRLVDAFFDRHLKA